MIFNILQHKVVILDRKDFLGKDLQNLCQRKFSFDNRFQTTPRYKLASVKKQLYNPKLPSIRRIERDEVLCRLPDEHCRHTTSFTEGEICAEKILIVFRKILI
jgi:hypothetical protein